VFGADRIMYASDYPFELGEDITGFIDESALSREDKESIYHSNAERLFKL
jgi:predicted TIM-barrel fold metal-dependent hydrolase